MSKANKFIIIMFFSIITSCNNGKKHDYNYIVTLNRIDFKISSDCNNIENTQGISIVLNLKPLISNSEIKLKDINWVMLKSDNIYSQIKIISFQNEEITRDSKVIKLRKGYEHYLTIFLPIGDTFRDQIIKIKKLLNHGSYIDLDGICYSFCIRLAFFKMNFYVNNEIKHELNQWLDKKLCSELWNMNIIDSEIKVEDNSFE